MTDSEWLSIDPKEEKTNDSTLSSKASLQDIYLRLGESLAEVKLNRPWKTRLSLIKVIFLQLTVKISRAEKVYAQLVKSRTKLQYPLLLLVPLFRIPISFCSELLSKL